MVRVIMIRVVVVEVMMIVMVDVSEEKTVNTLLGIKILLATIAARPRGRGEGVGSVGPRLDFGRGANVSE